MTLKANTHHLSLNLLKGWIKTIRRGGLCFKGLKGWPILGVRNLDSLQFDRAGEQDLSKLARDRGCQHSLAGVQRTSICKSCCVFARYEWIYSMKRFIVLDRTLEIVGLNILTRQHKRSSKK